MGRRRLSAHLPRLTGVHIGLITSGGDCPGLNAVIRGVVRRAEELDIEVTGFHDAWKGVMAEDLERHDVERCRGLLPRGGTILGTSRVTPYQIPEGLGLVREAMFRHGIDGFVVIGGNGSLSCAHDLCGDGIPCVGVPKTIDNDIVGTDASVGFDTAVHVATAAIDRLHTTAEAHDRVLLVELMGRSVGHIAVWAGIAGGAALTLIPEIPFDLDEVCAAIGRRHRAGRYATIVAVAEGAMPVEGGSFDPPTYEVDRFGHRRLGGIANAMGPEIEHRTGFETRVTVLGHVQRGGTPTAYDRVLSSRFGVAAADLVAAGRWGEMVALAGAVVVTVPLAEMAGKVKTVDSALIESAQAFFA